MKKFFFLLAVALLAFWGSCSCFHYEAYVTIVNIGNVDMIASVADDETTIRGLDSQTWTIPLDHKDEIVSIDLYAEPLGGGDYDEATATLNGDRDIVTWLTGWDAADPQAKPQKKKSYFLKK